MPGYDSERFAPPAPVARARISTVSQAVSGVPMLLDTGADVSVVPRAIAAQLGAELHRSGIQLEMFDGTQTEAETANLAVEVGAYRFRGIFVVADADYGILGRNILNLLVLALDGPHLVWSA